jgi:hypothetical protein
MTPQKKQKAVILLEKTALDFYVMGTGSVYKLAFSPTTVSNFEVTDVNGFTALIKTFFETNKIAPSTIIVVLADSALFSKTYQSLPVATEQHIDTQSPHTQPAQAVTETIPTIHEPTTEKSEKQKATASQLAEIEAEKQADILKFIDYVPFENVLSKTYRMNNQLMIAATNADFIHTLKKILESFGSQIEMVLPVTVLQPDIHVANGLSAESAKTLIDKALNYKQHNMLVIQTLTLPTSEGSKKEVVLAGKRFPRVLAMVGVFALLILILIGMFINMMNENAAIEKRRIASQQQTKPKPTATPTVVVQVASPAASLRPDEIAIQIINASGISGQDTRLRTTLITAGFTQTTLGQPSAARSSGITVVYDPVLTDGDITALRETILTVFPNATFRQNDATQVDVVVTIGTNQ